MASSSTRTRNAVLIVLLFATMLFFGLINGVRGLVLPLIKEEFGAGYDAQGFMMLVTTAAGTLATLLASLTFKRFGTKASYITCLVLSIGSTLLMSVAPTFSIVVVGFVLLGGVNAFYEVGKNALSTVVFTGKIALKMTLLHCCFGVGNILGPKVAEFLILHFDLSWRNLYLALAVPAGALLALCICANFAAAPRPGSLQSAAHGLTFRQAYRMPAVWLFAITVSLSAAVEGGFGNWALLYLQDVHGLDPVTTGASYIALFYVIFSLSRLLSGFVLEKVGYVRSLVIGTVCVIAMYLTGFALGLRGIWILPFAGLFIALYVPTQLAIMMKTFGTDSTLLISAGTMVSSLISACFQWLIGMINVWVGEAWGFRSLTLFAALYLAAMFFFYREVRRHGYADRETVPSAAPPAP
jgi:fucose permease